jgi:hypothetical protein
MISMAQNRDFYQLKIYTLDTKNQEAVTDQYLKEAYLPALKRQNIKNVGVFKSRPNEKDSLQKIYVLIPFTSMAQFENMEDALLKDKDFLIAGADYIQAKFDQAPYKRIESVILRAFEDMPNMKTPDIDSPRAERVYELRSYESATEALYRNKVEMFNDGGELQLFHQLGFNPVFFGEVISGNRMPNLMYLTTFENQKSRDAHWKVFGESAKWNELKVMPKYQNNMYNADVLFLYPTEYSDY